jgi:transposase
MKKKEERLVNKVKRLLRKAKIPRNLNRKGSKIYAFWNHCFALLTRAMFRLSYRRTVQSLEFLGFRVASKSTLAYQAKKIPRGIWQLLLKATISQPVKISAIDSTGLSGNNPSWHYVKRINAEKPIKRFFKLSILIDVKRRKILSLKLRSNPRHDILDVKYLIKQTSKKPSVILLDKGYDAEWLHKYFAEQNIWSIAPVRKGCARGFYRRQLQRSFPQKTYNQRSIVESVFGAIKRKYGSSVSSIKHSSATAEVYCRAIIHNIFWQIINYLGLNLISLKK